jgi:hypothetical protein
MHFELAPHPSTPPANPPFKVWARVERSAPFGTTATVNIWFGVNAPVDRFVMPAASEPGRTDGLWRTTCLEAFLREADTDAYREWNFAPSGDWAAYDFTGYREGATNAEVDPPPYVRLEDNFTWWSLGAAITVPAEAEWQFSLTAVIEEKDGTKSYWALAHPAEKPDFHDPGCFVAKLA